jgi:hypothetical protein
MSRRGRTRGNPVSLFAFQDIITSVTAIMILLVLILTLEFITRAKQAGTAPAHRRVAEDLVNALREAETRVQSLGRRLEAAQREASRATSLSGADLGESLAREERRHAELERRVVAAEAAAKTALGDRRSAEDRLLERAAAMQEAARMEAEAAAADGAAAALQQRNRTEQERQRAVAATPDAVRPTRLVYNLQADGSKQAVLVEVSGDGVTVLPADGSGRRSLGWGYTGPSSAFVRWLAGLPASRQYVVIMLRPSGILRYEAVRDAVIAAGIDTGTELVPEDLAIVTGEGDGLP